MYAEFTTKLGFKTNQKERPWDWQLMVHQLYDILKKI
jgi:hypothetical protein